MSVKNTLTSLKTKAKAAYSNVASFINKVVVLRYWQIAACLFLFIVAVADK